DDEWDSRKSVSSRGFVPATSTFETIKQRLQEAPALGGKYACAVLCQPMGTGPGLQPIAYYSIAYSEVELGLPLCYRAITMGLLEQEDVTLVRCATVNPA
uniref:Reverse transcriptase/retrotransposon-derived protein RNase H-like domain-containing protein n=1 Tax=Astyanax mexicanus TaxID=7994 RepID=A0A8B9HB10_ASTMX